MKNNKEKFILVIIVFFLLLFFNCSENINTDSDRENKKEKTI